MSAPIRLSCSLRPICSSRGVTQFPIPGTETDRLRAWRIQLHVHHAICLTDPLLKSLLLLSAGFYILQDVSQSNRIQFQH